DPAVNDDARIENLVGLFRRPLTTEYAAERRKVEQITLIRTDDQADVRHEEEDEELDKRKRACVESGVGQKVADQSRPDDSHNGAHSGANKSFERCSFQTVFEIDDAQCAGE